MFDLTNKVALVTGATGGIGGAITRALVNQGAKVAISGTRQSVLDAMAAEFGDRCRGFVCDMTNREAIEALLPAAEAALGPIDILVNNAGITRDGIFVRLSDEDWDAVIEVNLTAAFKLTRLALKSMLRRRSGRVISISSVVGIVGNAGQANYAASKAGLGGMSKSFAKEVAKRGITVNCIAPGYIDTAMIQGLSEPARASALGEVPMDRFGTPEDVAAGVVYLASAEASYITGATLHINGGMHVE